MLLQQVASLTLVAPAESDTLGLLDCLRDKVAELYKVAVGEPDHNHVLVSDPSGSVFDLPTFQKYTSTSALRLSKSASAEPSSS